MSGNVLVPRIECSKCDGTGWVKPGVAIDDWPVFCPCCKGRSTFSVRELARATGRSSSTIRRFVNGRKMQARTYERLLDRLAALL